MIIENLAAGRLSETREASMATAVMREELANDSNHEGVEDVF